MALNIVFLVSLQIVLFQVYINPASARPNLAAVMSSLGYPAMTEAVLPKTMITSNPPCGPNYGVVPSTFTNVPITEAMITGNFAPNLIPARLPVAESVMVNGNVVSTAVPNVFQKLGLPIAETMIPRASPLTTVIQDSSVSNNLANAVQLMVVSNLLSNTLPSNVAVNEIALPRIGTPVFEQIVGGGRVNTPLFNNVTPCGNVVKLM